MRRGPADTVLFMRRDKFAAIRQPRGIARPTRAETRS